jgi:hypothetical protein
MAFSQPPNTIRMFLFDDGEIIKDIFITTDSQTQFTEIQNIVGGHFQLIPNTIGDRLKLKGGFIMYANEDGKILKLEKNKTIEEMMGYPVVGPVIIAALADKFLSNEEDGGDDHQNINIPLNQWKTLFV